MSIRGYMPVKNSVPMLLTLGILCLSGAVHLYGGDIPKFGKVSDEELQLTGLPETPHADAIYLFDVGAMRIMDDFRMVLERHVRIKVLTEQGKEEANVRIPYWHENKIGGLKGHTITPQGKKIKLKETFDEREENWRYKVFTLPGVEVGSVLEYKYELVSENLHYLQPWYFQHSEFTRLSQLSIVILPGFAYNVFFENIYEINKDEEVFLEPGRKLTRHIYRVENLPPIKKEPYMSTPYDYMAALHFQLISYKSQYRYYKWIDTWEELAKKIRESYDPFLKPNKQIQEIVTTAIPQCDSKLDTAKFLYDYVRENIESSSRGRRWIEKATDNLLKDKKGTGAEKNILLVNLLRAAGLEAYPLLISTRSNGKIIPQHPTLVQFNYVLAYLRIGDRPYVLDTHKKNCPFTLLPTYNLVQLGFLIDDREGKLIDLPTPRSVNMIYSETDAALHEDGSLTATSRIRFDDYEGYFARNEINDSVEEDFVKETLKSRFDEVEIDSFTITATDRIDEPLHVEVSYRVGNFAQVAGDMIYAGLPTLHLRKSNPFKSEHRYFPVEFLYQNATTDAVTLTIPAGYTVDETPDNTSRSYNDTEFAIQCRMEDDNVRIQRRYLRRKTTYSVGEYPGLRNFYDLMIQGDQGLIVINRAMTLSETNE